MKKFLAGLFLGLTACFGVQQVKASPLSYDSSIVRFKISLPAATTSTQCVIISLSSSTPGSLYPHNFNRELQIRGMRLEIDKLAASTCTVKIGVMTYVDVSSGSVSYFFGNGNDNNVSNSDEDTNFYLDNLSYNLHVDPLIPITTNEGLTPYLITNDALIKSNQFNSTTAIPAPNGVIIPHVGDLIMSITKDSTNPITIYIEALYFGSF